MGARACGTDAGCLSLLALQRVLEPIATDAAYHQDPRIITSQLVRPRWGQGKIKKAGNENATMKQIRIDFTSSETLIYDEA